MSFLVIFEGFSNTDEFGWFLVFLKIMKSGFRFIMFSKQ